MLGMRNVSIQMAQVKLFEGLENTSHGNLLFSLERRQDAT